MGLTHTPAAACPGRAAITLKEAYGDIGRERVRDRTVIAGLELFRFQIV